jgi:glycosyltransferase involved in cell wall biosynthesis
VCIVSHRLGGYDGVSVEAAKWQRGFGRLGWSVTRAAGFFTDGSSGSDVTVTGLWAPSYGACPPDPDITQLRELCRSHDLLVIDNAGSLPTCPATAVALEAAALRAGIPTIVRHHDPPWQVAGLKDTPHQRFPLHDPRMLHVTINRLTESQFRQRFPELDAADAVTTMHNSVDTAAVGGGRRWATRRGMGVGDDDVLLVHPARNISRKNIPVALRVAGNLQRRSGRKVHYWLTDPTGEIGAIPAGVRVHRGHAPHAADLYAAADLVLLPSQWEGWGLPVVEAAAARRPAVTFPYPVLSEIHGLGIATVDHSDIEAIAALAHVPRRGARDAPRQGAFTSANYRSSAALDIRRLPETLRRAVRRATALTAVT